MATFKDRLNEAMMLRDIKPSELAKLSGVNEGAISQYRKGSYKAGQRSLEKIAAVLRVSIPWLMGADVPMEEDVPEAQIKHKLHLTHITEDMPNNVTPITTDRIPLVGRIACGEPILAEEHIEDHVDLPRHIKADFALECSGDSMIGAGIRDGDIVYIRKQPTVENGEIAAVVIDGEEATLKRFYRSGNKVMLSAENPAYDPFVYVGEEINTIRIVGRAVGFTHKL